MIINKKEIKERIIELIKSNNVNELQQYIQENGIQIKQFNNKFVDILITSIENDASIEMAEFIINYGKYKTMNFIIHGSPDYVKKTALSSAIKNNNFKLADYLIDYGAEINFIPYDILKTILGRKNCKYILTKGIYITSNLINSLIKDNFNYFLKQIFLDLFYCNEFILNLLSIKNSNNFLSSKQLETIINNEKNKIAINESMYKIAIDNNNYEAINILYSYDTRTKNAIFNDFYSIFKISDKTTKINFINKIKSQELEIPKDVDFLNCLENIITEKEKKLIIMNFIKENNVAGLKKYIQENNEQLNDYNDKYDECNDILKLSIENNVSTKMLNFIIQECQYEHFDYYININGVNISLLYFVIIQNKYKIFDILRRKNVDVNYGKILICLYKNKLLNNKNLKYILNNDSFQLASSTINTLITDNQIALLKTILEYYVFNNSFILKLLSMYKNKTGISQYQFKDIIRKEKNKLNFNDSMYRTAIEKDNYDALQFLYDYDNRNKDIALYEIFKLLDKDEKKYHNGKISVFSEKIKNHELKIEMDEKFLNNFYDIEEKRKNIMEKIKTNDILQLKEYITKNHILITCYNNEYFDILIYAIENDAFAEIIKYIIVFYVSLNFTVYDKIERKHKSPLSCAISLNKFSIAKLLLENGANINYKIYASDIVYKLYNEHLLNTKNLGYILDHGYNISSKLITMLVRNNKNDILKRIINFYVFDNIFILKLLSIYKNHIHLSSKQLNDIILNEKSKIKIEHEWYFEALYYNNHEAITILYHNLYNEHNLFFDKYELYKLFDKAIYDHNDEFIKNLFTSNWFDSHNFKIEEYLSSTRIRYRLDIVDYFIEKILSADNSFNYKEVNFENILLNILEINNITFNFIKRFMKKSLNHDTFDFNYVNFESVLATMNKLRDINEIDKQGFYKLCEVLIGDALNHKTFSFENNNFETSFSIISQYYFEDADFLYYSDLMNLFIERSFALPSFTFKSVNFEKILKIMNGVIEKRKADIEGLFKLMKFIIEKSFGHPTFDFKDVQFENILFILSQYSYDDQNGFYFFSYLIKLVIEKSFHHQTFSFNMINYKNVILILRQFNDNISILKYFIKESFNLKSFNLNTENFEKLLLASNRVKDESFIKYIIDNILNHEAFNFDESIKPKEVILIASKINDLYIFQYIIDRIFQHKSFEFNPLNIENILMATTKIKNNNYVQYIIKYIFSSNKLNNGVSNYKIIHYDKIIISAIHHNQICVLQNIFDYLSNFNSLETLDLEKLLLSASKIDNINAMKIILKMLSDKSSDDGTISIINKDLNTSYYSLIFNVLIKLRDLKTVKYIMENNELKSSIDINEKDKNQEYPIIVASYIVNDDPKAITIFEYLLECGANCNVKDVNGTSLFLLAIKNQNYIILQRLFKQNSTIQLDIDVNSTCSLMKAVYYNQIDKVETLINNKIIDNHCNTNQEKEAILKDCPIIESVNMFTPLIVSYLQNNHEIFEVLLKQSDINELDGYGYSIIHYSILKNDIETLNLLIHNEANVNYNRNKNLKGHSAIEISLWIKNKEILLSLLQSKNVFINEINDKGMSPLLSLLKMDHYTEDEKVEMAEILIKNGSDVNNCDRYGKSALLYAIQLRSYSLIKLLIENGAKFNINQNQQQQKQQKSILTSIVDYSDSKIFEYLLVHIKYYIDLVIELIIQKDRPDLLKVLIPNHININWKDSNDNTLLNYTILAGSESMTKFIIDNGIDKQSIDLRIIEKIINKNQFGLLKLLIPDFLDVNIKDDYGQTLLIYALRNQNENIIHFLVDSGADMSIVNNNIEVIKPIINDNNLTLLEYLVDHNLDINKKDCSSKTLINYAYSVQHESIIKYLIRCNANLDHIDNRIHIVDLIVKDKEYDLLKFIITNDSIDEILEEIVGQKRIDLLELFISHHLDINRKYKSYNSILTYAIEQRNIPVVECLICHGADIEEIRGNFIKEIIYKGKFDILKYLVISSVDIVLKSLDSNLPLIYIINKENEKVLKCLMDCGAHSCVVDNNVEITDAIVKKSSFHLIKILIPEYIDVNMKDEDGYTPLLHAIKEDNKEIIQYLLECNPNLDHSNLNVDIGLFKNIIKLNHLELLTIIYNNTLDVSQKDKYNETMLNYAIKYGNENLIKYLIEYGADVNKEGRWGHTPLIIAIRNRKVETVKLLIDHGAKINAINDLNETLYDINKKSNDKDEHRESYQQIKEILDLNLQDQDQYNFRLVHGINEQQLSIVKELIPGNANTEFLNEHIHVIYSIINKSNLELLKYLVEHGLNINLPDKNGNFPLLYAIKNQKEAIIKYFLKCGIVIDSIKNIHLDLDLIKKILKLNQKSLFPLIYNNTFDVHQKDSQDDSILIYAIENGDESMIKYLIDCGVDVNKEGRKYSTPLVSAIFKNNISIVKYLIAHGADINAKVSYGNTPLIYAIENHNYAIVQCLVDHVVDLNKEGENFDTPLIWAIKQNQYNIVKYLIENGADVNKEGEYEYSPLINAIQKNCNELAKYIIDSGANIDEKNIYGDTPLINAIKSNNLEIVKYLVKRGADVNKRILYGDTPLIWAIKGNHEAIVKFLIENGADVNKEDGYWGEKPLVNAIPGKKIGIVRYLIQYGADVHCMNRINQSLSSINKSCNYVDEENRNIYYQIKELLDNC